MEALMGALERANTTPPVWEMMRAQAEAIAKSGLAPSNLRGNADAILSIALKGRELGVPPMMALSHIHIIQGKPTISAELMRALAFEAGHEIWPDDANDNTKCTLYGKRSGSDRVYTVTFTIEDAQRAKITGKDNWKNYPRVMLLARATSELCRLMCPDVLMGASYTAEELGADTNEEGHPIIAEVVETVPDFTREPVAEVDDERARKRLYARIHAILQENNVEEIVYRAALEAAYEESSIKNLDTPSLEKLARALGTPDGVRRFADLGNRELAGELQDDTPDAED